MSEFPMPPALVEAAGRFYASGREPVTPRVAATVVLLRPGLEVYLIRRASSMAFASGMYAFPGGSVDPRDGAGPRAILAAAVRELVEESTVRVAPQDLVPWARWVTPEFEPRRYDTYFFLAVLPDGQEARDVSGEADHALWIRPADALDRPMLPPTLVTLRELAAFPDAGSAVAAAARRDAATPVMPYLTGDRLVIPAPPPSSPPPSSPSI